MRRIVLVLLLCLSALSACHAVSPATMLDLSDAAPAARLTLEQVLRGDVADAGHGAGRQRRYAFQPASRPQLVIAPLHGTWDWSQQGELRIEVQNLMAWAVTFTVDVEDAQGRRLHAEVALPAGPPQRLVIPLHVTLPRAFGMQAGPPMPFDHAGRSTVLATTVTGAVDLQRLAAIRLGMPSPQVAQTISLGRLDAAAGDATLRDAYTGIVDRYGQYTRRQWPEKVESDQGLRAALQHERDILAGAGPQPAALDVYGGQLPLRGLARTGWFHTQKAAGRWWLVTPEGHTFFSFGVNAVHVAGGRSYVEDREWMFTGLPSPAGAEAAFYGRGDNRGPQIGAVADVRYRHGRWFDFYGANLYRASGDRWLAAWRERALARLQAWGFNTIGNWSDDALGQAHRMAYTRSITIAGDYGNVATGYDYWGRMPDPFDPRFVRAVASGVAKATKGVRDDRWLLGYFADNELAWAGNGAQGRWALARGTLQGESRSAAKQAFIAILKKKYRVPERLGAAWGISLRRWGQLDTIGFDAPVPSAAHPAIAEDYSAWLRRYADRYFRTVAEAIHRHDPHHLFLGGRFAARTPEALAACARYCDVISLNLYADVPEHGADLAALHQLDRPVLISEFHFGSDDRGPFGKGVVPVWNEAQRGPAYARFVDAAMRDPVIVGTHWFKYADQPVTGRLLDGENSHVGLVAITDIPFDGFVQTVRAVNLGETEAPGWGR